MNAHDHSVRIETSVSTLRGMTEAQVEALSRLASAEKCERITVHRGVFGLPKSYLGFVAHDNDENAAWQRLVGGIDPEGAIST
jgi:hypothetical protein